MNVIEPKADLIQALPYNDMIELVSEAYAVCTDRAFKGKDYEERKNYIHTNIYKRGHESPLEHVNITVELVTSRGVLVELTRHRIASYSVRSTRYTGMMDDAVIAPSWLNDVPEETRAQWVRDQLQLTGIYNAWKRLYNNNIAKQFVCDSFATKIMMTANLRAWRHILKLRAIDTPNNKPYSEMKYIMGKILKGFKNTYPVFFEDIK